jgi:hypothetical protein
MRRQSNRIRENKSVSSEITARERPRKEKEIFTELEQLCSLPGFVHAIALFCYRDNLVRFGEELTPDDLQKLHSSERLIRTEVATLIGLLARKPIDYTLPEPTALQDYLDRSQALMDELHQAIASVWFEGFDLEAVKSGTVDPLSTGPALREPIFYGGDAAYNFQYREFAAKKYARDREWLVVNKGFDIDTALIIASALHEIQTEKLIGILADLKAKPLEEWTVLPVFSFSLEELSHRSGVDGTTVERFVAAFCTWPGGNGHFNSLQDYNLTNAAPILSAEHNEFILFEHYRLMEALYESPFFWMGVDRTYAPAALKNRGTFTETLAYEQLQRVFGAHTQINVHLEQRKGGEIGEIDALVLFGDRAVVLQAKSKRLTLEARKGNDLQIKDDFKKAIQDSYDQALSCTKALLEGGCKLKAPNGSEIAIATPLKEVFPICVVADHYPALAFQARQFLNYETSKNIAPPLVTDVFALDAITEMLDTPLRVLSYLDLRRRHGEKIMAMHELTLLSTHIKYNLWVSDKYDFITLGDDLAVHLDAAMAVRREGLPGARTPEGVLTRLAGTHVGRILSDIESRPDPPTIDLGLLLLSLDEKSTDTINAAITEISSEAAKDGTNLNFTAGFRSSSGLTIHCNERTNQEAAKRLFAHCSIRKYSQKASSWFGLALSPGTAAVRFGLKLEGEWREDPAMEEAVRQMPAGVPPGKIKGALKARRKPGRNDLCPCGSGLKYKKCCLRLRRR